MPTKVPLETLLPGTSVFTRAVVQARITSAGAAAEFQPGLFDALLPLPPEGEIVPMSQPSYDWALGEGYVEPA